MAKSPSPSQTEPNSERLVRWTLVLAIGTIILALASVVGDYFIYNQWKAAIDAQSDTRKQLSASVTFVGAQQLTNDKLGTTINYVFLPTYKNWGATRTGYFSAWASVKYFEKDIPNSQDFTKPYEQITFNATILGPNDAASNAVGLSAADAIKAKNKEGTVAIWGHAEYSDIYSKQIVNLSFCLKLLPVSSDGDNRIVFQATPLRADCNTGMPSPPN